jgi:hypothetical protein
MGQGGWWWIEAAEVERCHTRVTSEGVAGELTNAAQGLEKRNLQVTSQNAATQLAKVAGTRQVGVGEALRPICDRWGQGCAKPARKSEHNCTHFRSRPGPGQATGPTVPAWCKPLLMEENL